MDENTRVAKELVRLAKLIAAADDNDVEEPNEEEKLKINDIVKALKLAPFKKWLSKNKSKTIRQVLGAVASMNIVEFFSLVVNKSQVEQ